MVDTIAMRALLHIPSGDLVRFVKLDSRGRITPNGSFYVTLLNNEACSIFSDGRGYRTYLEDYDNLPLLLQALVNSSYVKNEFEVIEC